MKQSYIHIFHKLVFKLFPVLAVLGCMIGTGDAYAFPADRYAPNSVLCSGKWRKVKVSSPGMQLISNSQLSAMGFKDPSKVKIYGYGGRMISETLSHDMPDDLPLIPSVVTQRGVIFFGHGANEWTRDENSSLMRYSHTLNPYSDFGYYFVTDSGEDAAPLAKSDLRPTSAYTGEVATTFVCRQVHDVDLWTPANTGRRLFGEDFRSPSKRSFTFALPDAVGAARTRVSFGHKVASTSRLSISSNGNITAGNSTVSIEPPASSSLFMSISTAETEFKNFGNKLELTLNFTSGGIVNMARLDYIEVEWERALKLNEGQLYIYDNATTRRQYSVDGCNANTRIWDVTVPTSPIEVTYTLNGSKAVFETYGNKEYIVFNPEAGIATETAGTVSNQNLHSLSTPDLVIITPSEFRSAAEKIADLRRRVDGFTVHVIDPQSVYNEFSSGTRDVSAFRKLLKMWKDRSVAEGSDRFIHCLLMGRPICDGKAVTERAKSAGYETIPIWSTYSEASQSTSYSTDDFIGMTGDPTGIFNISAADIGVAVGRFPVSTAAEAEQAAAKLIEYVENPVLGPWRSSVIIIADDQDNGVHLDQAEEVYKILKDSQSGQHFTYDRVYLDAYLMEASGTGPIYRQAKERMLRRIDEGVLYIDYIGHANPKSWGHENLLNWTDIISFSNKCLPILYGATCEFARWDDAAVSGAEHMWLNPNGGFIVAIAPSRAVYITNNGILNKRTASGMFERNSRGLPKSLGQVIAEGKNAMRNDDNKLRYCFLGDPCLRMFNPSYRVRLDSIADCDMTGNLNAGNYPTIKARQQVKLRGSICNPDGNADPTFNGKVHIRLLDAEKPVTTNANGKTGVERIYNDRLSRLYVGMATVENGKWETTLYMPSEIANNYTSARFELYAYSEDGVEANGSEERLYVYGFDTTAPADNKGPEISVFALNREGFANGDIVMPSSMVMARFSDESGINVSESGIGHNIALTLDGNKYYNDLAQFYSPDPFDATTGSISYPLNDIEAGDHTLQLTVWDNANNSTTATLNFSVSVSKQPEILNLTTNCNPAKTDVKFILDTDLPMTDVDCTLEVIDLQGRVVWSYNGKVNTGTTSGMTIPWNLTNKSGIRVERGIYLYRATIVTPQGTRTSRTSRLAVTSL